MKLFGYLKLKDPTLRGAIILAIGPAVGYLIGFLLFVFLTRVYTEEQFGYYSTYLSLTMVLSSVVSGKYDAAIIASKDQESFVAMIKISLLCNFILSVVFLIAVLVIKSFIHSFPFHVNENISQFLIFIPLSTLLTGTYNVLSAIALRDKAYKKISISEFQMKTGQILFQLLFGVLFQTISGLFLGFILSMIISILIIIRPILKQEFLSLKSYSFKYLFTRAKENRDYPMFVGTGQLINVLTQHLPILLIGIIYGAKDAGLYVVITKVFSSLNYLLGQTTNKVYFANVSANLVQANDSHKYLKSSFINIIRRFFIVIAPIFIIIALFGQNIFQLIFYKTWIYNGTYLPILTMLYFVQLLSMPFNLFIVALNRQRLFFYRELVWLALIVSIFITAWWVKVDITTLIYCYSIVGSLYYSMYILSSWNTIKHVKENILENEAVV